ncbi:hypothetical protein N692_15245 [Lactiplantibacillus plantarum EGD-AQ4]|nr:hypothetical protein N692_15245 [Lactiplantibacillus plantarum EGD-AQ4]
MQIIASLRQLALFSSGPQLAAFELKNCRISIIMSAKKPRKSNNLLIYLY